MIKLFWIFLGTMLLFSCGPRKDKTDPDTIKEGNKSITFSTDTAELSKLINITTFKPIRARFKYTFIDNSGEDQRLSAPGPSDYYLQAVLYFDSTTFSNLKMKYDSADYPSPNLNTQNFNFGWLDEDVRNELLKSNSTYHGHPDFFLNQSARLWLLDNKVLLTKSTN
jgi:hypothetical protein